MILSFLFNIIMTSFKICPRYIKYVGEHINITIIYWPYPISPLSYAFLWLPLFATDYHGIQSGCLIHYEHLNLDVCIKRTLIWKLELWQRPETSLATARNDSNIFVITQYSLNNISVLKWIEITILKWRSAKFLGSIT